ncbi:MAG: glycosyltransferase family 1 protein [Dorea sp.]|nr:glycosyltransferase family 1 protein [Dorea sp.]
MKILVFYLQLNKDGGTEKVIINYYKNIRSESVVFSFLVQKKGGLDDDIIANGDKVYVIEKNALYKKNLQKFFLEHKNEYDIIHAHMNNDIGLVFKCAKKYGNINHRISHSHNSRSDLPKISKLYKVIRGWSMEKYSTNFWGCSSAANEWFFPRNHMKAVVVNNSIEVNKFAPSLKAREEQRQKFNISPDEFLICNIGRLVEQKNQLFLIDVMKKFIDEGGRAKLIIVGEGHLRNNLVQKISELKLEKNVFLLGNRFDIPDLLSASDVMVSPSVYEGLSIVNIEGQCSGLPCIVSKYIPKDVDLGINLVTVIDSEQSEIWAHVIKEKLLSSERKIVFTNEEKDKLKKYDIYETNKRVLSMYLEICDGYV